MKKSSYHFLRVGLAITFIWIGVLIFRDPIAWGSYIEPWAVDLLPVSLAQVMVGTAVLDVLVGLGFLFNFYVWVAALLGSVHLLVVMTVSGVTDITIRDAGLLTGALALFIDSVPEEVARRFQKQSDASLIQ